jgi:hypothetical protein
MFGTVMAQVPIAIETEHDAVLLKETCFAHIATIRPAGRAVGCWVFVAARPPGGSPDGDGAAGQSPNGRKRAGACEYIRGRSFECQPPDEELPWRVHLESEDVHPRIPKCWLVSEHGRGPLRGSEQCDRNDQKRERRPKDGKLNGLHLRPHAELRVSVITRIGDYAF